MIVCVSVLPVFQDFPFALASPKWKTYCHQKPLFPCFSSTLLLFILLQIYADFSICISHIQTEKLKPHFPTCECFSAVFSIQVRLQDPTIVLSEFILFVSAAHANKKISLEATFTTCECFSVISIKKCTASFLLHQCRFMQIFPVCVSLTQMENCHQKLHFPTCECFSVTSRCFLACRFICTVASHYCHNYKWISIKM